MHPQIQLAISIALETVGVSVKPANIPLAFTGELKNGDYASSVALQHAKEAGMAPLALAEKILAVLSEMEGVEKTDIAGPGFINFYLAKDVFAETLENILARPEMWGRQPFDYAQGKKIMVEYTDPNPFKEFHIGHLMSNAIGESIARLLEFTGADVKRANYQGDVGPHVAKAIWAVKNSKVPGGSWGDAYIVGNKAYETDDIAKREIEEINAKVYARSDELINSIYDEGRAASLAHFEDIYKVLGTKFDHYFFESETAPRGLKLVREHEDVFEKSDGAIVYKGEQDGLHTRVFITSRGTPTYETKDLGLLELKHEQGALDKSITVTAHEQSDYFKVMIAAANHLPEVRDIASKTRHVTHGMMRFAEGKMSSRTGNVITGESLLEDIAEAARERASESRAEDVATLAQDIAVGAIKYQILKQSSGKDIVFDRARALSLEGDSGPYLQYTYARASQVFAKAAGEGIRPAVEHLSEPLDLVRLMYRFPAVVERAAEEMEPHLVTNFLIEFAAAFNRWYAQVRIVDGKDAPHKVAITDAARITLRQGLYLIGIPAPEKM